MKEQEKKYRRKSTGEKAKHGAESWARKFCFQKPTSRVTEKIRKKKTQKLHSKLKKKFRRLQYITVSILSYFFF